MWGYYYYTITVKGMLASSSATFNACAGIPLPTGLEKHRKTVLQKAYAKVGQAEFEAGVELGELKETLQMLRNPLESLKDFFFKHGGRNLKDYQNLLSKFPPATRNTALKNLSKDAASSAANTWLELRYGLRPLISTIESIAELIEEEANKLALPKLKRKRAFKEMSQNPSAPDSGIGLAWGAAPCKLVCTDVLNFNARVYYTQGYERSTAQKLGLSPENLPEIAWELTRLSFVVDWIFSIGPWLGSFRVKPSIDILGDTSGIKIDRTVDVTADWEPLVGDPQKKVASAKYTDTSYTRVINTGPPLLPQYQGPANLDLFKLVDSLALILQPLLRKLK
jgi:hypothetical protein